MQSYKSSPWYLGTHDCWVEVEEKRLSPAVTPQMCGVTTCPVGCQNANGRHSQYLDLIIEVDGGITDCIPSLGDHSDQTTSSNNETANCGIRGTNSIRSYCVI